MPTLLTRPAIRYALVFAAYVAIVLIVTWPLAADLSGQWIGFVHGDAYENAHHVWWFQHALQTGQPLFYQTLMGWPDGIEGVTLWAHPLQFFPAWLLAFVLPLPAAVNVTVIAFTALNGLAAYALALYLTRRGDAAFLGGLVYLLYPTMQGHWGAGHYGLMVQFGVPLFALALLRLRDRGGWRRIAIAALLLCLTAAGHTLQLIYVTLPIAALIGVWLIVRREWAALRRVVIVGLIGGAIMGVFLLPVIRETLTTSAYADEGGAVRYSADLLAIVTPSFRHPLVETWEFPRRVLGVNIEEGAAYFGVIAFALAIAAVATRREARPWAWLAAIAYGLALGPLLKIFDQPVRFTVDGYESGIALPFALLANLPGFSLARTPGRFAYALALAAAVLAAYGASVLVQRLNARRGLAIGAIALLSAGIAFEYQTFWPLPLTPAAIPAPIQALSERDDIRAVFDVPWDNLVAAKAGLYLQTAHEHALIAGQVTRRTPVDPARLTLLERTLNPALLDQAGADVVIVHRQVSGGADLLTRAQAQLGEPLYLDAAYGVFSVPDPAEAAPAVIPPMFPDAPIEARADAYLYSAAAGFVTVELAFAAVGDAPRTVDLLLDGVPIQRVTVDGSAALTLPIPVGMQRYHTLTAQLDPPCARVLSSALTCRSVTVTVSNPRHVVSADPTPTFAPPLTGAALPLTVAVNTALTVDLVWDLPATVDETAIRYVHVVDAAGMLVAQQDAPIGTRAAGTRWAERVTIPLADIPPGPYRVIAGWYRFPDITPLFGGGQPIGQFVIDG